jgi:hypothetical protein
VPQTIMVTFRLRDPERESTYAIVLSVGQTRRIRFPGVMVRAVTQGPARMDSKFECP